jgi:hypothetical protein
MYGAAQVIEKNHFPEVQNRATSSSMQPVTAKELSRRRARLFLLLMAAVIAAATLAPMAVLAG